MVAGYDVLEVIAERIREVAEERDLPLSHLADLAGVSRAHLWRVLNVETACTVEWVAAIADVLEVEPYELLMPEESRKRERRRAQRRRRK